MIGHLGPTLERKGVNMDPKECVLTNQYQAEDVTHLLVQFLEKEALKNPVPTMETKRRMPPSTPRY